MLCAVLLARCRVPRRQSSDRSHAIAGYRAVAWGAYRSVSCRKDGDREILRRYLRPVFCGVARESVFLALSSVYSGLVFHVSKSESLYLSAA